MAMKKALVGAALAAGLALVIGDTALGANVNAKGGNGGRGGNGGSGGAAGDIGPINRGRSTNKGVRGNTKRRAGQHAHLRKADPQPNHGFDF